MLFHKHPISPNGKQIKTFIYYEFGNLVVHNTLIDDGIITSSIFFWGGRMVLCLVPGSKITDEGNATTRIFGTQDTLSYWYPLTSLNGIPGIGTLPISP